MSKIVILCGPSCVGKTPLRKALKLFYPELERRLKQIVLYNSRGPRPGELEGVDYYFRSRQKIESLRERPEYIVVDARSDVQAVGIGGITDILQEGQDALYEGNVYMGRELMACSRLKDVEKLTVFVSPLSKDEIMYLKSPERNVELPELVADIMRRKLLRRTEKMKGILSQGDLGEIEVRCEAAYKEICDGWQFSYIIANHDGEDSENWSDFYYPVGDARKTLICFAGLLRGKEQPEAEKWERDLLKEEDRK